MSSHKTDTAIFAGGCFWCMEGPFKQLDSVSDVISGYTGGNTLNPSYEEVCSGRTGHYEAIKVLFNPQKISYGELLDIFWRQIDPTDGSGQFVDRGTQYKTAIFYVNDEQKKEAELSKEALSRSGRFNRPIVTEILPAAEFYPAEDYHQNFYIKSPHHYKGYRANSGRDVFLEQNWKDDNKRWKKPPEDEIKKSLSDLQYSVTRKNGTERAFDNIYWNNKKEGLYVDIVTGEPLFSSRDKFDSGSGWPSFTRPVKGSSMVEKGDHSFFMKRTEVRSRIGDSHLGHVFPDGPEPTGKRYCINSASLRFIPVSEMEKEGYGDFLSLFDSDD